MLLNLYASAVAKLIVWAFALSIWLAQRILAHPVSITVTIEEANNNKRDISFATMEGNKQ